MNVPPKTLNPPFNIKRELPALGAVNVDPSYILKLWSTLNLLLLPSKVSVAPDASVYSFPATLKKPVPETNIVPS